MTEHKLDKLFCQTLDNNSSVSLSSKLNKQQGMREILHAYASKQKYIQKIKKYLLEISNLLEIRRI